MKEGITKTNLDLTGEMLAELDNYAASLNVSRQAVIKVLLRTSLDQMAVAESLRNRGTARGAGLRIAKAKGQPGGRAGRATKGAGIRRATPPTESADIGATN